MTATATPRFITVCAWCGPATPAPPGVILTHGICAPHAELQRVELRALMAQRRVSA